LQAISVKLVIYQIAPRLVMVRLIFQPFDEQRRILVKEPPNHLLTHHEWQRVPHVYDWALPKQEANLVEPCQGCPDEEPVTNGQLWDLKSGDNHA
jgi:hypothetical protein